MKMDQTGIHVAQYITDLPPKDELEKKLHMAIRVGREAFERKALQLNNQLGNE